MMNKTEAIFLRMTEEEKRLFTGAANMLGLPLAAWARMVMRQEARRQADRQGLEDMESPPPKSCIERPPG